MPAVTEEAPMRTLTVNDQN